MMKKRSVFGYFADVAMIFGLTVIVLDIFCILFGDGAKGFGEIFALGSAGLSVKTSFEFLLTIATVVLIKYIFMTEMLIKDMPVAVRTVLMFASAFAATCGYIVLFRWFPVDMPLTWVLFVICFAVSCTASYIISSAVEKQENARLEEALKKYKEEN